MLGWVGRPTSVESIYGYVSMEVGQSMELYHSDDATSRYNREDNQPNVVLLGALHGGCDGDRPVTRITVRVECRVVCIPRRSVSMMLSSLLVWCVESVIACPIIVRRHRLDWIDRLGRRTRSSQPIAREAGSGREGHTENKCPPSCDRVGSIDGVAMISVCSCAMVGCVALTRHTHE